MITELTIEQAKKQPANFMYIFASDEFLNAIEKKHADVIRVKRANQKKLLMLSAQKYLGSEDKYTQYTDAIREQFIAYFDCTPAEALVRLAQGKEVAGKNWAKGMYGIGVIKTKKFAGTGVTVQAETGDMWENNTPLSIDHVVYGDDGTVCQKFAYDSISGNMYMSQKDKKGKWYAASYSNDNGQTLNASGITITGADSGSIWETIILNLGTFLEWLINLFGGSKKETLSAENTLPDQQADGFVYESGIGEAGGILLALVAGGTLLATGALGGKKKKSK